MHKGDRVNLTVNANYKTTPSNNNFLGTAYGALFSSFDAAYGSGVENGVSSSSSVFDEALSGIDMSGKGNSSTAPRAFLNYIFFDQEMNYVRAGFLQITTAAQGIGVYEAISLNDIVADREGYILAYLSNENAEEVAIHWDDFTVYHGKTNVVSADSYYPFGLTFNGYTRTASTLQNYKFQGQEHQPELGWDQFKWRNSDPTIGRFFTLDPMSEAFFYNSPYAFSENKVTTHIELEGLEAYFIHGTQSGADMWTEDLANFLKRTVTNNSSMDVDFEWNEKTGVFGRSRNWLLNNKSDRLNAAKSLVKHIEKTYNPDEELTLIGHSHGGNVAIQAAKLLWNKYKISVNIVNFNTPAYNDQFDAENPNNDPWGINSLTHFYTKQDGVAGGLAGSDKYNESNAGRVTNIELNSPLLTGWMTSHYMHNTNRDEVAKKRPKKKKKKSKRNKTIWPQDR